MAKSTQSANAPACIRCKHSRPFKTPRSVLVERFDIAVNRQMELIQKSEDMPWWKLSRPTEFDLTRADWDVSHAKHAIKRFDSRVMCTRFPEHVEKENESYCAEFKRHTSEFSRKSRA